MGKITNYLPVWHWQSAGYVYLATGHPEGLVKIGHTTNLSARFERRHGFHEYGFRVRPMWAAHVPDCECAETMLHHYFAGKRLGKLEWFALSAEDISLIKENIGRLADAVIEDFSDLRAIPRITSAIWQHRSER